MKRVPLLIAVLVFVSANGFAANVVIDPPTVTLTPDTGSFTVNVRIENAAGLAGFQFDLDYNPVVAGISGPNDVAVGDVFQSISTMNVLGPDIEQASGNLTFGAYTYESAGVTGDFTLATVTFTVAEPANGALVLNNVRLTDASSEAIPVDSIGNAEILYDPDETITFTAVFEAGPNGTLEGQTTQTVNRGESCSQVEAVPDDGYEFSGWTGDYTGNENPLTVETVTEDMRVTANFTVAVEPAPTPVIRHTVTFTSGDHGVITGETEYTAADGESLSPNLACEPDPGWRFAGWTGFDGTECPPEIANVTADMAIRAEFEPITYTVTFTSGENGSLSGETVQTVAHGSDCSQVTAVPDEGYRFAGWTGYAPATENEITVTGVTSHMSVHATFEKEPDDETDDTDGDGVDNDQDDYPDDPKRATPITSTGNGKILVDVSATADAYLTDVRAMSDFDPSLGQTGKPDNREFENGMVSFTVNGASGQTTVAVTFPSGDSGNAVCYQADESGFHELPDAVFDGNKVTLMLGNGEIVVGIAIASGGGNNCFIDSLN